MSIEELERIVRLQQEQINLHQKTLTDFGQALTSLLSIVGKVAGLAEELTVKQFVADVEKVDKCGAHCGCGKHNG